MQYLAAYTLATLSGAEPSTSLINQGEQTLTAILNATGKPVDAAQVKAVIDKLKGKQVHEVPSAFIRSSSLKDKPKLDQEDLPELPLPKPEKTIKRKKKRRNSQRKQSLRRKKRKPPSQSPRKKTSISTCSVDLI